MLLPVFGCLLCTKYSMSLVVARCIFPCILSAKEKLRVMHTTEIEQSEEEDMLFTKQGECESCWWRPSLQNLVKSWTDFLQGVFARRRGGLLLFTWQNGWITLRLLTPFCKTWWKLDLTFYHSSSSRFLQKSVFHNGWFICTLGPLQRKDSTILSFQGKLLKKCFTLRKDMSHSLL